MKNPIDYLHETAVHQLLHSVKKIEDDSGLVETFDYEETRDKNDPDGLKRVNLELTYLLPE